MKHLSDNCRLPKSPKNGRVVSRRLQDRRLWEQIENLGFRKAAYCLTKGYSYICWGGYLRAVSWKEVRGSYREPYADFDDETLEFLFRCKRDYLRWSRLCDSLGLNRGASGLAVIFGFIGIIIKVGEWKAQVDILHDGLKTADSKTAGLALMQNQQNVLLAEIKVKLDMLLEENCKKRRKAS